MTDHDHDLQGMGMTSQRTRDRLVDRLQAHGIGDQRVLAVMRSTPRHIFVEQAMSHRAYEDNALPIGHSQTISQPFIVAMMTEAVIARTPQKVLEIGTGSGYQTAVLAQLVPVVYSVERIWPLLQRAQSRLERLKLGNVHLCHGDGFDGWPEEAPFDAILVTAAPKDIPNGLLQQLAPGGRMVIPVGAPNEQRLLAIDREDGELKSSVLEWVRFVPLLPGVEQ